MTDIKIFLVNWKIKDGKLQIISKIELSPSGENSCSYMSGRQFGYLIEGIWNTQTHVDLDAVIDKQIADYNAAYPIILASSQNPAIRTKTMTRDKAEVVYILGNNQNETLYGIEEIIVLGQDGNDHLISKAEINEMHGGPGSDILDGGNSKTSDGEDNLFGNSGDDVLRTRNNGESWLIGDSGRDTFVISAKKASIKVEDLELGELIVLDNNSNKTSPSFTVKTIQKINDKKTVVLKYNDIVLDVRMASKGQDFGGHIVSTSVNKNPKLNLQTHTFNLSSLNLRNSSLSSRALPIYASNVFFSNKPKNISIQVQRNPSENNFLNLIAKQGYKLPADCKLELLYVYYENVQGLHIRTNPEQKMPTSSTLQTFAGQEIIKANLTLASQQTNSPNQLQSVQFRLAGLLNINGKRYVTPLTQPITILATSNR